MFRSGFFKSVITLLSGSATAQIIMVLSYFIIARWFGPDFIGEIRVFASITLIGALLVNGGYELAIMLPSRSADSLQLLKLCFRILLVSLLIMAPIGFFLSGQIAVLLKAPALNLWAKILPFSIFMEGAINLLHQFLVRNKKYKNLSFALLSYAIVYAIIALPGVYTTTNINWLFTALVISQLVKLVFYFVSFLKVKNNTGGVPKSRKELASKYIDYPLFHLGSGAANMASREMVVPMLSSYFGAGAAGLYSMSIQILYLPMRFLTQAVPQVFYQRIAKARNLGIKYVRRETLTALSFLLLVSAIPTFILALFGPDLFAWALGEKWRASGEFIKWLAAFAVVGSVVSPLTSLMNVNFKLRAFFIFNVLLLVSRLGAIAIGAKMGGAQIAIAYYGLAAFIGAIMLGVWLFVLSGIIKIQRK
ncbi:MAG: oligosaccharide flippase family protein [Bacteroidia bacterium]